MKLSAFFGVILLIGALLLISIHVFHVNYLNEIGGSNNMQGYNNTTGIYKFTSHGIMVKEGNGADSIRLDEALENAKKRVQILKESLLKQKLYS